MKKLYRLSVWIGMLVSLFVHPAHAQSQEKVYSLMMLNFAKGIQWPKVSADGNFVIGVLEYPPLVAELISASATARIGERKIEVKEFNRVEEIKKCHIIFIPAYKAKLLTELLTQLGTQPTLIVSNKMDYAKKSGGVNFVLAEG